MAKVATAAIMSVLNLMMINPEEGARNSIYLASSLLVKGISGKFFNSKQKIAQTSKQSYNEMDWARLWELAEKMTKLDIKSKVES